MLSYTLFVFSAALQPDIDISDLSFLWPIVGSLSLHDIGLKLYKTLYNMINKMLRHDVLEA